jgi:hypothetical protein
LRAGGAASTFATGTDPSLPSSETSKASVTSRSFCRHRDRPIPPVTFAIGE